MTQTEIARRGLLSATLKKVARAEGASPEKLADLVARGLVVIPFNPRHSPARPAGIGRGLRTKVNVNLGTSRDFPRLADELRKVRISLDYGADALMDLSTGGDLKRIRKAILARTPLPLGTVPIYQAAVKAIDRRRVHRRHDRGRPVRGRRVAGPRGRRFHDRPQRPDPEGHRPPEEAGPGRRHRLPRRGVPPRLDAPQRAGEPVLRPVRPAPRDRPPPRRHPQPGRRPAAGVGRSTPPTGPRSRSC